MQPFFGGPIGAMKIAPWLFGTVCAGNIATTQLYIGIIINKHKDPCEPMVFFEKYEGVNYICLNYIPWIRNPGIPKNSNPANFFNGTYNNISD